MQGNSLAFFGSQRFIWVHLFVTVFLLHCALIKDWGKRKALIACLKMADQTDGLPSVHVKISVHPRHSLAVMWQSLRGRTSALFGPPGYEDLEGWAKATVDSLQYRC